MFCFLNQFSNCRVIAVFMFFFIVGWNKKFFEKLKIFYKIRNFFEKLEIFDFEIFNSCRGRESRVDKIDSHNELTEIYP